jgi:uncharacterized membrane protein YoaT (DUF817 family)
MPSFFSHHFIPDMRLELFVGVAAAFGPTWVYYRPYRKFRRMPLLLGFGLVALFIWGAENIGTFARHMDLSPSEEWLEACPFR